MKEEKINNFVRIGSKSKNTYLSSALFCLDKEGTVVLEGLGRRRPKTLDIADKLEEISNVEVGSPSVIDVEGTSGLRIKVEKEVRPP